jgi:hypothetical protein
MSDVRMGIDAFIDILLKNAEMKITFFAGPDAARKPGKKKTKVAVPLRDEAPLSAVPDALSDRVGREAAPDVLKSLPTRWTHSFCETLGWINVFFNNRRRVAGHIFKEGETLYVVGTPDLYDRHGVPRQDAPETIGGNL